MPNKPLQAVSLTSPGYFGLNNQDSGVTLNPAFATQAYNAVIDKSGRIGARKGWAYSTTSGGTSSAPKAIFEFDNSDGTYTIISAGNAKLFTGETTMTEKPVRDATDANDLAYTISANNWQIVQAQYDSGLDVSPHAYLIQKDQATLVYHKTGTGHAHTGTFGFQRLGDVGSVPTGYTTTTFTPNCGLSAFGRLWLADIDEDRLTVYYSALLDASDFTGVGSGFINLEQVVGGGDKIVGLVEHNNFLIIFCERNIVIYANADNIDTLQLQDVIVGVGCIARDSVQVIGTDVLFLSNSGIRSLGRTIQEKSVPMRDMTKNVRDQFMTVVAGENKDQIRSVYHEAEAFYLINLPGANFTFCLDVRSFLEDGSARTTIWDTINPGSFCSTRNRRLLLGQANGIATYTGYQDNGNSYNFSYFTPYIDFGDASVTKILKKIIVTIVGASNTALDIKWAFDYNSNYQTYSVTTSNIPVAEYGIAEYGIAEYVSSAFIEQIKGQLSGSGNIIQIGVEALIDGTQLSLQKLDIYSGVGRTI